MFPRFHRLKHCATILNLLFGNLKIIFFLLVLWCRYLCYPAWPPSQVPHFCFTDVGAAVAFETILSFTSVPFKCYFLLCWFYWRSHHILVYTLIPLHVLFFSGLTAYQKELISIKVYLSVQRSIFKKNQILQSEAQDSRKCFGKKQWFVCPV